MVLETKRTILRPFAVKDAEDLFDYAKNPEVGLAAGWTPHKNIEDSKRAIQTVFSSPAVFAVVSRENGRVIGSAGFRGRAPGGFDGIADELGFALNPAYWGQGIMPEVVRTLLKYGFERLGLNNVWAVLYADNIRCKRVLEKCGFTFMFQENLQGNFMDSITITRKTCFYVLLWQDWIRFKKREGIDR